MKTQRRQGRRPFQMKVGYYESYYLERITELEKLFRRRPRTVRIEMIGTGEIPADTALLIRSLFLKRPVRTRLIINARSTLQGGAVMVWLLGDGRTIRDGARLYFRRAKLPDDVEVEPDGDWKQYEAMAYRDSYARVDPDEADYVQVLEVINEYLPVREFAGRLISIPVLRQFGLVENEKTDRFLAAAFGKSRERPNGQKRSSTESTHRQLKHAKT